MVILLFFGSDFEQGRFEGFDVVGPVSGVGIFFDFGESQGDFGVEVVQVVDGEGFGGGRQDGAAILAGAVVREDDVHQTVAELVGESFGAGGVQLVDFLIDEDDALDEVSDEAAFVGVLKADVVFQFGGFADVMQEERGPDEVPVEIGVVILDSGGQLHQREGVLEQAADVSVMQAHGGGGFLKLIHKFVVGEEEFCQPRQMRIFDFGGFLLESGEHVCDVFGGDRQELFKVHFGGVEGAKGLNDHLQRTLVVFGSAFDLDETLLGQGLEDGLGRLPHAPVHLAGGVAEVGGDVIVAAGGGAQLGLGDQKDLVDAFG